MIKQYLNKKGEVVVIADMVDAYLLNAYAYYKKQLELANTDSFISDADLELIEQVKALKAEIDKRKLV